MIPVEPDARGIPVGAAPETAPRRCPWVPELFTVWSWVLLSPILMAPRDRGTPLVDPRGDAGAGHCI